MRNTHIGTGSAAMPRRAVSQGRTDTLMFWGGAVVVRSALAASRVLTPPCSTRTALDRMTARACDSAVTRAPPDCWPAAGVVIAAAAAAAMPTDSGAKPARLRISRAKMAGSSARAGGTSSGLPADCRASAALSRLAPCAATNTSLPNAKH